MSRVIAFHGSDHKVGTSMICQCMAEYCSEKNKDSEVLLIHAEGCSGTAYSPSVRESIEMIRPYLAEKLVDINSICEKAKWRKNLSVISGPDRPGNNSVFFPGMAELLLDSLREKYALIICDCGAEIEHGLALGALCNADEVFMVLTQSESAVRRYEWMLPLYRHVGFDPGRIIINKYEKSSPYTESYLRERLGMHIQNIYKVRKSSNGILAEIEEKSFMNFKELNLQKDIAKIAQEIMNEL